MADFQYKFFRTVYDEKELKLYKVNNPVKAAYCSYNNQVLQLVVSSLYISAMFSGIIASKFARVYGRKASPLFLLVVYIAGYAIHSACHAYSCYICSGLLCLSVCTKSLTYLMGTKYGSLRVHFVLRHVCMYI